MQMTLYSEQKMDQYLAAKINGTTDITRLRTKKYHQ